MKPYQVGLSYSTGIDSGISFEVKMDGTGTCTPSSGSVPNVLTVDGTGWLTLKDAAGDTAKLKLNPSMPESEVPSTPAGSPTSFTCHVNKKSTHDHARQVDPEEVVKVTRP